MPEVARIKIVNTNTDIAVNTRNKEIDRGIFNFFCIWLHKLHTIFEITKEQIINRRKSLRVQIINEVINITTNLKYDELLNFQIFYFFSEYPNPFDLA